MDERTERMARDVEVGARGMAEGAQDVASQAGSYVQSRTGRVSERAQDLAREADDRVERLTGRSLQDWAGDLRHYVREHPLRAIAVTIGVGFVLGKILQRG